MVRDVVIGIDPHKHSWTAVAVDPNHSVVGELRVMAGSVGYRQLCRLAEQWPSARWAVEGAAGWGRPLVERLTADQLPVIDVPPKLSSRVRQLSTGHGRKTDRADALSVAVAALTGHQRHCQPHDHADMLRLLNERRDDLVRHRTQSINRLHALLTQLVDGGAARSLTADRAAELLRRVRSATGLRAVRRRIAVELVADIRRLDRQMSSTELSIRGCVTESGTTLTEVPGVGPVLAARIIGRVGAVSRFPNEQHFASYCGTAPIEVSSGDVKRHRLSRAGDRQLNHALHLIALSQIRCHEPAHAYYQRKRLAGKGHREAMRCLKRRLASVIYRQLVADQTPVTPLTA